MPQKKNKEASEEGFDWSRIMRPIQKLGITHSDKPDWEDIGYHRIMGGFFYVIVYAIFGFLYVLILPLVVPFSQSLGMFTAVKQLFAAIFTFADFGLSSALSRFIAEYRVKDPKRTREYIRFFIWFQSFTGLIQTTIISMIGLFMLEETDLEYLPYVFMFHSLVQYPGWLSVFKEALKGYHRFDKMNIVGLLNQIVFQNVTLIIGAQLGKYIGYLYPALGPVMGVTIGITLGMYLDDFSTTIISGIIFSKVAKELGFSIRDVFSRDISKEVAKESLKFGMGTMLYVFSSQIMTTFLVLIFTSRLTNYSTWMGSLGVLNPMFSLGALINGLHFPLTRPSISEAYHNKKFNYVQYIIASSIRFTGIISGMINALLLVLAPSVISVMFPEYQGVFSQIFLPMVAYNLVFQFARILDETLISTGNQKFNIVLAIVENAAKLIGALIFIYLKWGVWAIILSDVVATIAKQGVGWIYTHKKIIPIRFNLYQTVIVPGISAFLFYIVLFSISTNIRAYITGMTGEIINMVVLVVLGLYILPGPVYFFIMGLFGGFCDSTLEDFGKGIALAGPSKFVVTPWYKFTAWAAEISTLHGKRPLYSTNVKKEIKELMDLKARHEAVVIDELELMDD